MTRTAFVLLSALCFACGGEAPSADAAPAPALPEGVPPAAVAATPVTAAVVGQAAPDFELTDTDGVAHKLSSLRGKTVVLEWFNPDCPFVKAAHGDDGVLAKQPARVTEGGAVWLAINSGAPGKQGHGLDRNKSARDEYGMKYPVLLDESGVVGKSYGATNTPHTFVIDGNGVLVYGGAVDAAPMGAGDRATNYVDAALADLAAGRPVALPQTKAYGCSVKYAS